MLDDTTVREIKACEGVYRGSDVSRHYGLNRSTVCRIWKGEYHSTTPPASDFPDIATPLAGEALRETAKTLLQRGMQVKEVASELNITPRYVYKVRGSR